MADFTLGPAAFPVGTTVGAYPRTAFVGEAGPFAEPLVEAVTDANLETEFTGLAYDTQYWAAAQVGGRWHRVSFRTERDTSVDPATQGYVGSVVGALTKSSVGLGNVDNTSDAAKPVSTAQATAIAARALDSEVRKWFPVPTGGDDAPELLSRMAAGEKHIAARELTYRWNQAVAFLEGVMLQGAGKRLTIIEKGYNGDFGTLDTGAGFADLTFDGKGATRTGKGFVIAGTDGQQHAEHFRLIDCAGACLEFAHQAGSQSTWFDGDIWRVDDTAADAHAIVIEDNAAVIDAVPRKFIAMESGGKKFISLGGCTDLFINGGGYLGNIAFTDNSRGVCINGQRIGGTVTPWVIKGFNHAIDGCDMGMPIQIAAGASAVTIGAGNTYNITAGTPAVSDLSVFSYLNMISIPSVAYVPTFSSSGTQPTIGNGTVAGIYSRSGVTVDFAVSWTLGSTSSMGTGAVDVSLPYTAQVEPRRLIPCSYFDVSAGAYFGGFAEVVPNDPVLRLRFIGTGGLVSATTPFTWAAGDILRVGGSYSL